MKVNPSADFLELASEQRIEIIKLLTKQNERLTNIAKTVDATAPEVHRNLDRLIQTKIIKKNSDGSFCLTTIGKIISTQIPLLEFLSENKKYFESHSTENIPEKFVQRFGSLANSKLLSSYMKILDKWKEIHANSNKYVFNLLVEVPYSYDLFSIIDDRLNHGVKIKSIFSESTNVSKERKLTLEKHHIKKHISEGKIERRMGNFSIVLLVNEKEALLMFPSITGETDMSKGFFSDDASFHEWCVDYFEYCWGNSSDFHESKLNS
jgi:predicted transcriptional regulator